MIWKTLFLVAVLSRGAELALIGGFSEARWADPGVKDALQFAVVKHNNKTNDMFLRGVARKISAEKQVVNGLNFRFVVDMGKTACRKDGLETNCSVHQDPTLAQTYQCTFVVYRKWDGTIKVTSEICQREE